MMYERSLTGTLFKFQHSSGTSNHNQPSLTLHCFTLKLHYFANNIRAFHLVWDANSKLLMGVVMVFVPQLQKYGIW